MRQSILHCVHALLLGFVLTWIVSIGLAAYPRFVSPGAEIRSRNYLPVHEDANERVYFDSLSARWIGIHEQVFAMPDATPKIKHSTQRGVPRKYWWNWKPFETSPSNFELLSELHESFEHEHAEAALGENDTVIYTHIEYGFPAISHRVTGYQETDQGPEKFGLHVRGAVIIPNPTAQRVSAQVGIPYKPVWSGLAINTLIYTLMMYILLSINRTYKHARRFHRGCCPLCGYNLQYSYESGCTECGYRKQATQETTKSS